MLTKQDILIAQNNWCLAIIDKDVDALLALYDFGTSEKPLLFKPTLAGDIRTTYRGAKAYFVGNDHLFPFDKGFLNNNWTDIVFKSAVGPVPKAGDKGFKDMGHYIFTNDHSSVHADYTFTYHEVDGEAKITLHHSSLTWTPV